MKNRLALQRIYWIKPKVPIVEKIKDIYMALNLQEEYLAETPSGKGRVFKKQELIAEVAWCQEQKLLFLGSGSPSFPFGDCH